MGIVTFLTVRFVEVIVVLLLILFMPSIPPNSNFTYFKVTAPKNLEGKLALNDRLGGAERLYENELKGPEAFAEYNGELYSSLFGDIVKFSKGHIVPVVKFGKPCAGFIEESICGRPLGIQFDKNGLLYATDAYMGVWKVDIKTGQKTLLISMDTEIEGKKPMLPNSLALSENGDIFWTDSSTEFKLEDGLFSMLADGTGRLIHYDAKTKTNKVLMDGLHFANGIILSSDEEFILVSESSRSRLYRFYLKGPKKGTHDIFADGLPGVPDNLNSDGKDGFLVPLVLAVDSDHPSPVQIIGPFPLIRKLTARITALIQLGFKTMHRIYPNHYTQTAIHWIGHFESVSLLVPDRTTILHLSKTGEIIDSLHTLDKSVHSISDAFIFGDHLYLGSPYNNYVGRISLFKAGLGHLVRPKREVPVKQAAPLKQAQATPPTQAPKKTPPPTQAPKQTPPPTQAPKKTPPPTQAPKKTPPTTQTPPKQQTTPPPTPAPKQKPTPTQVPVKQTTQAPPTKQSTPPTKQAPPPTPAPAKQATPTQQAPSKQAPPTPTKQTKPKDSEKETPKVIPVKENSVPKSESIKPRK